MGHAISLSDPEQLTCEWPECYQVIPPPSTILRKKLYDLFVCFNQETTATPGRTTPTVALSVSFSVCDARSGVPRQQMCRVTPLAGRHHKRAPLNKLARSSLEHLQRHCWLNVKTLHKPGGDRDLSIAWDQTARASLLASANVDRLDPKRGEDYVSAAGPAAHGRVSTPRDLSAEGKAKAFSRENRRYEKEDSPSSPSFHDLSTSGRTIGVFQALLFYDLKNSPFRKTTIISFTA